MKRDSRLSGALHIVLHMAAEKGPLTSERLASSLRTNPVVVRRLIAGLRDQGFVSSAKGHGGGWTLTRDPSTVTLRDIYLALGSPRLLAMSNQTEAPGCRVEEAVNAALAEPLEEAAALLLARFGEITLADLQNEVQRRGGLRHHDTTEDHHAS